MKCKYCSKWAGFFKSYHPECLEAFLEEQARIEEEKKSFKKDFYLELESYIKGYTTFSELDSYITKASEYSWLDFKILSDIFSKSIKSYFSSVNILSFVDDTTPLDNLHEIRPLFDKFGQSTTFRSIVTDLYIKSLKLFLDGKYSIDDMETLSLNIFSIFRDDYRLFDGNDENNILEEDERTLLRWVGENIDVKDLRISDDIYNRLELYIESNKQLWISKYYDDDLLNKYAIRLGCVYILYKLRHGEFIEGHYGWPREQALENIILKKGEELVWSLEMNISAYQTITTRHYVGGSSGASIRIAKGFYVRTGSYEGYPINEESEKYLGFGNLALTTKALVFYVTSGYGNSVRIPFDKTIAIKYTDNGFIVDQEGIKKSIRFEVDDWCNALYYFILNVMQIGDEFDFSSRPTKKIKKQDIYSPSIDEKSIDEDDILNDENLKFAAEHPYLFLPFDDFIADENLFYETQSAIDCLYDFAKDNCYDSDFMDAVNQIVESDKQTISAFFYMDIMQCLKGIGGEVDLYGTHAPVLVMASLKILLDGDSLADPMHFAYLTKDFIDDMQKFTLGISELANDINGYDTFIISDIFSYYDKEKQTEYLDLISDVTHCLIKIKNTDPLKSKKFLKKILDLKNE